MPITDIGSSQFSFSFHSIVLRDVLHVPSFTKNLLSVSKLLQDNVILIEICSSFCVLKDRHTLIPILQAKLHNGLYLFPSSLLSQAYFGAPISADCWHARLGRPSSSTTLQVLQDFGLPYSSHKLTLCHNCLLAKAHKLPFSSSTSLTTKPLELVRSDLWGPAPISSHNGFRYFMLFIDDVTKFCWIYFLHSKDEVVRVFTLFKAQAKNLLNTTIKTLRTDGGTEYKPLSHLFLALIYQVTCPYTPQQNGVAERKHRHIIELSLATMTHASIPTHFCDDIFASIVYLINRLPSSSHSRSPFTLLFDKDLDYSLLRVLGCACFPLTCPYNSHKLQNRSTTCAFLGYVLNQKGYKCLDLETNRTYVSRHVRFDENCFPFKNPKQEAPSADTNTSLWLPLVTGASTASLLGPAPNSLAPLAQSATTGSPSLARSANSHEHRFRAQPAPSIHSAAQSTPLSTPVDSAQLHSEA